MVDRNDTAKPTLPPPMLVVPLTKKVKVDGEEVDKLSFREPTGGDIETAGNPVILNFQQGTWSYEPKSMTQMMSLLAAVPPSTIRSLSPIDWNTIAVQLAPNFIPDLSL